MKQAVISFGKQYERSRHLGSTLTNNADGGSIRGYSSSLMLRDLMTKIATEEQRLDSQRPHSPFVWDPIGSKSRAAVPDSPASVSSERSEPSDMGVERVEKAKLSCTLLPCRYFTYAAGTSTGG